MTLADWFVKRDEIVRLYREELDRDVIADPDALTNWLYHAVNGRGVDWIRDRIRESAEWQEKHGGTPTPIPSPGGSTVPRVYRIMGDGQFLNRMYAYWPSLYVHDGVGAIFAFAGHADGRPRFFKLSLEDESVQRLGPLLGYVGTGEGWYWDADGWIYICDGPRLRRVNPFTGADKVVFDISEVHPGCRLWQAHSSEDGTVHSATVERIVPDGPYIKVGTVVFRIGRQEFYPAQGNLDESIVTPDGKWLIIQENDDNRIITLATRETRLLKDADGAVAHCDVGHGFVVGEDNHRGACVLWDLNGPLVPERKRILFETWSMGHVSVRGDRCLLSDESNIALVALDGSGITPLFSHGMVGGGYDNQVHANLDPTGRAACWMSNEGGASYNLMIAWLG